MSDKVRVLRVLEYSGDRLAVEHHLLKVLQGEKTFEVRADSPGRQELGQVTIRAATIGLYPEILEAENNERT